MSFRKSLLDSTNRAGLFRQTSRVTGSGSGRPFHALARISQNSHVSSGLVKNFKSETCPDSSILQTLRMKFGSMKLSENVSIPYALSFKNYIHSGKQAEIDAGRTPGPMDVVQGILNENENNEYVRRPFYDRQGGAGRTPGPMGYAPGFQENGINFSMRRPLNENRSFEANADIVHMKLMRNNCFITVTDSKGNKKLGVSAGKVAGKGAKLARYSAEAAAEEIGRKVRQMKTKSVVVKVNGFTFFRKKKQAILSFKDGYTNSRGNMNPVVYIEDTTRKPHNGCRLPKKRRI